jgi:riboflavin kinase/FMN adenylyltransferase
MFDGVHAGHRSILAQLQHLKELHNGESVLITFDPHPQTVFQKNPNFGILTTMDEKLDLLAKTGLDHCIVLPFTHEFSQLSGEEYIYNILYKGTKVHTVVIGYDHNYGKNASGNFALMQKMAARYNFHVKEIPAFDLEQIHVSSTKIRTALRNGNVEQARSFLTYSYSLAGSVVQGKHIGHTLGVPTANIAVDNALKIIPAIGVYAARAELNNQLYKAVVNIGTNPTIAEGLAQTIEVHILHFNADIYRENLRVQFEKHLRNQQTFASRSELQQAMQYDIENAEKFFRYEY